MNKNSLELSVYEIVGTSYCVASSDGEKVYNRIANALNEKKPIVLSFLNITVVTSAFLNTAIGQLYGQFTEEQINSILSYENLQEDDRALLTRVIDTAKQYFQDPSRFDAAFKEEDDDGDEQQ